MIYKRGQITLFVIIGLIILLTFFILSYYRKESIEETELIMPELIPIQQYVQSCTENIAREAIEIIGINGGYIYFPPWIQNDPGSYLKLSPIEGLKNPYWWYDGNEAVPPLDFIAKQIEDYAKAEMPQCLDNFSAFHHEYNIIELGEFNVIAEIGEEDIAVKTVYPIEIQDKFNKTLAKLQKFPVTIPIRLKKVYELATKIMERENKDYFIEKKTIDLISLDDDEIPTTGGPEINCGEKRWNLERAEKKLKKLLEVNLPYIKIKGTKFREDSRITPYQLQDVNPWSQSNTYNDSYYYYHYIWDVSNTLYPNMHVSFNYDQAWDIKIYARPSKGKYLISKPQKIGGIIPICVHLWHFTYDVIFPVKATIVDDETDKNEPYSFTFAFKAQINHNEPDRTNFAIATFDTRDAYLEEEYCADVTNEITLYAQDKITKNAIRNANLSLTCGRYVCNIGATQSYWDIDSTGTPKLIKRVPYCSNAILRGTRAGYEDSEMFIQTGRRLDTDPEDRIGKTFTLEMRPVKEFNFSVVKHKMLGIGISGKMLLDQNQKATVNVKNTKENFESYSAYPLDEPSPLKLLDKGDYDYDLEIYVADNETITGGYKTKWTISHIDLRLGKNITFHVIEKDFRDDNERYLFFIGLEGYSKQVPLPEIR